MGCGDTCPIFPGKRRFHTAVGMAEEVREQSGNALLLKRPVGTSVEVGSLGGCVGGLVHDVDGGSGWVLVGGQEPTWNLRRLVDDAQRAGTRGVKCLHAVDDEEWAEWCAWVVFVQHELYVGPGQ